MTFRHNQERFVADHSYGIYSPAGGTENAEEDTKKASEEEELSFVKSSICEQWKKLVVRSFISHIHCNVLKIAERTKKLNLIFLYYCYNNMGENLLLNFGAAFKR